MGESVLSDFAGIPMGCIIHEPFACMAESQMALANVYLSNLFELAFEPGGSDGKLKAKTIKFTLNRMVYDKGSGQSKVQPVEVEAPLLSLVPVPAFLMDEGNITFSLEIKQSNMSKSSDDTSEEVKTGASFMGFSCSTTVTHSTHRENTSETDKTAKITISATAKQQPPAEGMAKLTALFASTIEPIAVSESQ